MQKRICPDCGQTWYSAAENETWSCPVCDEKMPPLKETKIEPVKTCPYLKSTSYFLGFNKESFLPCIGDKCMAWSPNNCTCKLIDKGGCK